MGFGCLYPLQVSAFCSVKDTGQTLRSCSTPRGGYRRGTAAGFSSTCGSAQPCLIPVGFDFSLLVYLELLIINRIYITITSISVSKLSRPRRRLVWNLLVQSCRITMNIRRSTEDSVNDATSLNSGSIQLTSWIPEFTWSPLCPLEPYLRSRFQIWWLWLLMPSNGSTYYSTL